MTGFRNSFAGLIAATLALALASPAHGALECGDEIKKDIKLKETLDCSGDSFNALQIVKNDVTVDLNGKKVIANSSYSPIYNDDGYDNLTVKDGTLEGGVYGIYNYYGSYANFSNLKIDPEGDDSGYGIYQQYSIAPKATNVTVKSPSYGWYGYSNASLKLKNFTVTDDNNDNGYGVYESYSSGTIDKLKANKANYGAFFSSNSSGLTIKNSVMNDAGYAGIYVSNSSPLFDYKYTLKDNTANDSEQYGFYANYDTFGGGNKAKGADAENCYNVPC